MTPGETFWPRERVFLVLTGKGRIAKEGGRPLFFMDYEGAKAALKPDYLVGAIDILRVTAIASMEGDL
jgi:hypothetical protein